MPLGCSKPSRLPCPPATTSTATSPAARAASPILPGLRVGSVGQDATAAGRCDARPGPGTTRPAGRRGGRAGRSRAPAVGRPSGPGPPDRAGPSRPGRAPGRWVLQPVSQVVGDVVHEVILEIEAQPVVGQFDVRRQFPARRSHGRIRGTGASGRPAAASAGRSRRALPAVRSGPGAAGSAGRRGSAPASPSSSGMLASGMRLTSVQ